MDNQVKKRFIDTILFSCMFFITASASLYLSEETHVIETIWFANAIGIVLLLRYTVKEWAIPLLGIMLGNYLCYMLFGNNFWLSSSFTFINLVEIILIGWLFRYFQIINTFDQSIKSVFILVSTTVLIAPFVKATLGAYFFAANNTMSLWINWFVGEGICMASLLPVLLCLERKMWFPMTWLVVLQSFLCLMCALTVTAFSLIYFPYAFIMVVIPILIIASFTSIFTTLFIASCNMCFIFILYNMGYFILLLPSTLSVSKSEELIFLYIPVVLSLIIPYLLSFYMRLLRSTNERLMNSESLFRSTMESSSVAMALVSTEGYCFLVNEAFCKMLGYSKDEFKKLTVEDITYIKDKSNTKNILKKLKSGKATIYHIDKRYVSKSGKIVWVNVHVTNVLNSKNSPQYYVAHIQDITKNRKLEIANTHLTNALYDEKEHLRILLSSIADSVIATDDKGLITFMNPEAEKITGWKFSEAKGLPHEKIFIIDQVDNEKSKSPITVCLKQRDAMLLLQDAILINRFGQKYNIQYSISLLSTKDNKLIGAEVVFQDLTHATSLEYKLKYDARHDSLTGLLNRKAFEDELEYLVEEYHSTGTQYILCYIDLDFFKIVNDSAGHVAGDELLKEVASVLISNLHPGDVLARLGGDEFGILLINNSLFLGRKRCQQLITQINAICFIWKNKNYRIGASIGMVLMSDKTCTAERLLSNADVACFAAKVEGRNRVFIYQADNVESMEHFNSILMASMVRDAIENDRLTLYAQKITSTSSNKAKETQYEFLIRMFQHETNEIISASAFIVIAERFNLMVNIDRWVLTQVLTQYDKKLSRLGSTFYSINLSANSLNDPDFLAFLLDLIKKSALKPEQICFEITETAAMSHINKTIEIVNALKKIGCKIALDDFGVGLSSFSYVKSFAVDYIKIDGSFVKNLVNPGVDMTIVQTINEMAHRLGMKTIAEYVENPLVLNLVTEIGVDYVQGYAIGEPECIQDIIEKPLKSIK